MSVEDTTYPLALSIRVREEYIPPGDNEFGWGTERETVALVAHVDGEVVVVAEAEMSGYVAKNDPQECLRQMVKGLMS